MSGRRFFSSAPSDASRPSTRTTTSSTGPFPFSIPIDSFQNLSQSILNSVNSNPVISNLMSGARTSPLPAGGAEADCCDSCQVKFTVFKRRRKCIECDCDFCSGCFTSPDLTDIRSIRRVCRRCRILNAQPLDRLLLMTLRVRDLRWYLEHQNISVSHCKEKSELVDLVLHRNGYRTPSYGAGGAAASSYRSRVPDDSQPDRTSDNNDEEWIFVDNNEDSDPPAAAAGATAAPAPTTKSDPKESCDTDFKALTVDDLNSEEHIRQLSARQLKILLSRNFVDFKGCCEKDELMEKVLRLWRERREAQKQNLEDIPDENLCKICMEQAIDCVLLECGHMISCVACGKRLSECPICRQYVVRAVRIFKS